MKVLLIFLLGFLSVSCVSTNRVNGNVSTTSINTKHMKNGKWLASHPSAKVLGYSFIPIGKGGDFAIAGISGKTVKTGYWEEGKFKYGWGIKIRYGTSELGPGTLKPLPNRPAVAIVDYIENEKVTPFFQARGYIFFLIQTPNASKEPDTSKKSTFILRHWSGAIGCTFTDFIFFENTKTKPVIEHREAVLTVYDKMKVHNKIVRRDQIVVEAGKLCK